MTVRIHDLNTGTIYLANCPDDCRGTTDRQVYEMVVMLGTVVTCGKVIGELDESLIHYRSVEKL